MAISTGDIDMAILANLRSNHFPPIPAEYVPLVRGAISAVNEYGPYTDSLIGLESIVHTGMIPRDAYKSEEFGLVILATDLLTATHPWDFVDDDRAAFEHEEG
jgi:hypothetical protein